MKRLILLALPALLSGCQVIRAGGAPAGDPEVGELRAHSAEWRGLKFARNRCSDCHAVEYEQSSPIPKAPTLQLSQTPPT